MSLRTQRDEVLGELLTAISENIKQGPSYVATVHALVEAYALLDGTFTGGPKVTARS
jgi:hypothetical protein